MPERKVYCPELDQNCTNPECSIKICLVRQERLADEQWIAEWESQQRRANREEAAWRAVCDLVAEHNSLIEENKSGVAQDKDGNIFTVKLQIPKGRGAKQKRQAIIEHVLQSEKQDTILRFSNALDAMLREEKSRLRRSRTR